MIVKGDDRITGHHAGDADNYAVIATQVHGESPLAIFNGEENESVLTSREC
jgi:hypothetical protein